METTETPQELTAEKKAQQSLTGPKIEASEETTERPLKSHEKIDLLIRYLEDNDLLDICRPKESHGDLEGRPFVLETMSARKIIIPANHLKNLPGLKHLAIWISDPDPNDFIEKDYSIRGTFVYLTETWLDNDEYCIPVSGCSALYAIANAINGRWLAAPHQWASILACGQWPLFLSLVWVLLFIEVARAFAPQSNLSHAPPERVRTDRALVDLTQTTSKQVHCPDSRWISEQKRISP